MSTQDKATIKARLSKYADLEAYLEANYKFFFRGGMLIRTKKPKAVGTVVQFLFKLANDETALRGEGTVKDVKNNKAGEPIGMVLRFTKLDKKSKETVQRALALKGGSGRESAAFSSLSGSQPAVPTPPPAAPPVPPTEAPTPDRVGDATVPGTSPADSMNQADDTPMASPAVDPSQARSDEASSDEPDASGTPEATQESLSSNDEDALDALSVDADSDLADDDLGAIADALDATFDSLFSGSFAALEEPSGSFASLSDEPITVNPKFGLPDDASDASLNTQPGDGMETLSGMPSREEGSDVDALGAAPRRERLPTGGHFAVEASAEIALEEAPSVAPPPANPFAAEDPFAAVDALSDEPVDQFTVSNAAAELPTPEVSRVRSLIAEITGEHAAVPESAVIEEAPLAAEPPTPAAAPATDPVDDLLAAVLEDDPEPSSNLHEEGTLEDDPKPKKGFFKKLFGG